MSSSTSDKLEVRPSSEEGEITAFRRKLAGIFALVALGLVAATGVYLAHQQAEARRIADQQLGAIADLKLNQITQWRAERFADAHFISEAPSVAADLRRFLENTNAPQARADVLYWLNLLKAGDRYHAVMVFDPGLNRRLAIPESAAEESPSAAALIAETLRTGQITMSDLHRIPGSDLIHMDLVAPVFEDPRMTNRKPIAVVMFQLDARRFLFPLVQSWPMPSASAETLLVRREGDQVLFLSDLRHRGNTALNLRLPLSSRDLPAAKVLRGETNTIQGVDYRGVPVVAMGRKVEGTSWALVAKIDREEIYAGLRRHTRTVVVVLAIVLIAGAALVGFVWRQREAQFLTRSLVLEKERSALAQRVAYLMQNANDIILLLDGQGRVLEANRCALDTYGYSLAEMQQKNVRDLRGPEAQQRLEHDLAQVQTTGSVFLQAVHRRCDGSTFPVEISSRKVEIENQAFILSIVRDITERKAHEREIERVNRLYVAMGQVNQSLMRAHSRQELLHEICDALVQFGGFKMAWIGWMDPATKDVNPVAMSGDHHGYVENLRISAEDCPRGRGPAGCAIREDRPCICNDVEQTSQLLLWRDMLAKSRWQSIAAFPIRDGEARGVLAVYADHKGFFGGKEQALLEQASSDISFGLGVLHNRRQRAEAEESLRQLNAELELRVAQRTSELQAKNRALEEFSYSVAHDLKAPLRSIVGFSQMLLKSCTTTLGREEIEDLNRIEKSARRMHALIEDLLAYSRLELQPPAWATLDLEQLVNSVIAECEREIAAAGTDVRVRINCAPVRADESGLTQALRNVIGNAIKYSAKAASPTVEITGENAGGRCILKVRDNGVGFPMEYKEKMFQVFERLHATDDYPGTGIGLAIARRAMTRVGGQIWAEGETGKGATFFLEIPCSEQSPVGASDRRNALVLSNELI